MELNCLHDSHFFLECNFLVFCREKNETKILVCLFTGYNPNIEKMITQLSQKKKKSVWHDQSHDLGFVSSEYMVITAQGNFS